MTDARNIEAALEQVLVSTPDPRDGLSDPVFNFVLKVTPMINVDLLVRDDAGRTLLAWREEAYGTGWHIPGGIIRYREPMKNRITAVARLELGAMVEAEQDPCAVTEFCHTRRGHFISLMYRCSLTSELMIPSLIFREGRPQHGMISWIKGVPTELYPAHRVYEEWLR